MEDPKPGLKVLLVGIQSILSDGLVKLLSKEPGIELRGPVSLEAALAAIPDLAPNVILLASSHAPAEPSPLLSQLLDLAGETPVIQTGPDQQVLRLYSMRELPASKAGLLQVLHSLSVTTQMLGNQRKAENGQK